MLLPARALAFVVGVTSFLLVAAAAGATEPEFLSPVPGSTLVLPETNIIMRPGGIVDAASVLGSACFQVRGSISGPHDGQARLSDDRRTLTFRPNQPFAYGEQVTCVVGTGLVTDTRGSIPAAEVTFTIAGPERESLRDFTVPEESGSVTPWAFSAAAGLRPLAMRTATSPESLPPDFPNIQAWVYGTPAPGRLFVSDLRFNLTGVRVPSYLMILDNDGKPFFYRQLSWNALDFKQQPNGHLTYFDAAARAFFELNARYQVVDSFRCGNGYSTDSHDLVLLPNGHALLMSYDPQIIDMRGVALGGRFNARVIGLILQELDAQKNVVFQWRSWDHFQITDIWDWNLLAASVVDYAHGNSLDADPDGNLIISSRHMNEVTKISRSTGGILWRLGGRNNQFTFVNDPIRFCYQHDARRLSNGNLTMLDNGNCRVPVFSRAVEYAIDETLKTATLAWQYRRNPDVFGFAAGSVQRFANGNTLIGWGATNPTLTEVAPDGSIVSELTFDPNVATYRALRFVWPPVKPAVVTLNPMVLTLGDHGGRVTARIQPEAASFQVTDIEPMTVRLMGTVAPDSASARWGNGGDSLKAGILELTVKFPIDSLAPYLSMGLNRLEVTGSLKTGEVFRGVGEMRLNPEQNSGQRVNSLRLQSAPGAVPVLIAAEGQARTFAVYDVQGRRVKRWQVAPGALAAWDGRDSNGRPAASGVYLIRAEDGAPWPALKVVIAR